MNGVTSSDLRRPTDYKARYERAEHQRMAMAERVKRLELERDGLLYRLGVAEAELKRRAVARVVGQAKLDEVGA